MIYLSLRNEVLSRRPDLDIALLDKAFEFADRAHAGQKRYSGEDYIIHPVEVAKILLDLHPDMAALQAALLHDVTEDTPVPLAEIEQNFGSEVAALVQGLEKLAVVKVPSGDPQEEKWKKMFLAMARDIRIVFIKLADRLHNMRTLHHVPEHKRERIARETLGVHAAIASRLGIYQIKSDLEDLCFEHLYPEDYKEFSDRLATYRGRSEECMEFATSQLEQLLVREGIGSLRVQGRMKHLWSIYQKLQKKSAKDLGEIYDLFALRVILPDRSKLSREDFSELYSVLGLLHGEFLPMQDRFKDYIAAPKANGYRSLHTTVLGMGGDLYSEPTEIQIRTEGMHEEAEIGIASHWSYKLGKSLLEPAATAQLAWLKDLASASPRLELDLYPDKIFVLTPKDQVIELPVGSNPIDFAFAVHTEVGNKMTNAKVNGRIVPIDYELKSGEKVEVVTRNNAKPSRYWISLAKTASARSKIKNWFNRQDKEANTAAGREMLNKELHDLGKPLLDERLNLLKDYAGKPRSFAEREQLLENLGLGNVTAFQLLKTLFPGETAQERKRGEILIPAQYTEEVLVTDEENLPVVLSACCKPRPPHEIVGYVTKGQFIRIHKKNCRELHGLDEARFLDTKWKQINS
jgi:GTP pyrophosphokinase